MFCGAKVGRDCEEPVKKRRGRPSLKHMEGHEETHGIDEGFKAAVQAVIKDDNPHLVKQKNTTSNGFFQCLLCFCCPKENADYNYEVHDPRLMSAHRLLLSAPEIIYSHPILAAGSFGINLGAMFCIVSVPGFPQGMTFDQHMEASKVRYISAPLLNLFQKKPEEVHSLASMPWEPECMKYVCEHVVREAVTTPLPSYGVREWNHRRRLVTSEGKFSVLCTGYILSNLKVMVRKKKKREKAYTPFLTCECIQVCKRG